MHCDNCGAIIHGHWYDPDKVPIDSWDVPDGYHSQFKYCPLCGTEQ